MVVSIAPVAPPPTTVATVSPKPVPWPSPILEAATLSTSFAVYPVPALTIVAPVTTPAALTVISAVAPVPVPPVKATPV